MFIVDHFKKLDAEVSQRFLFLLLGIQSQQIFPSPIISRYVDKCYCLIKVASDEREHVFLKKKLSFTSIFQTSYDSVAHEFQE
jgi:hypothetical protein